MKKIFRIFSRALAFIGEIISGAILILLYYTAFAVFALPYKIFCMLGKRTAMWHTKVRQSKTLQDLSREF